MGSPAATLLPRGGGAGAILLLLLASLLPACAAPRPDPAVAALASLVSEERLRAAVVALCNIGPRPPHDAGATEATVAWLEGRLRALGYEPRREPFTAPLSPLVRRAAEGGDVYELGPEREVALCNVVAEIPGIGDPGAVVELGAHFDTVPFSPGADDNASGVAAVLEAARILRDARPRAAVRFCFFAAEEFGFLGSAAHVENVRRSGERHLGLFDLDMVGFASSEPGSQVDPVPWWIPYSYSDRGDFVLVLGNFASGGLGNVYEDAVEAYVPDLPLESANRMGWISADGWRSDHVSYWRRGLEAVQITDTGELRTEHYHRSSDTPDRLDYGFLRRVTAGAVAAVMHRAGGPAAPGAAEAVDGGGGGE